MILPSASTKLSKGLSFNFSTGANPNLNPQVLPYSKPSSSVPAATSTVAQYSQPATTPFSVPASLQNQFDDYLKGDQTLQAQLQALGSRDPNTGLYSGSRGQALQDFLAQARQAEIAYGKAPDLSGLPKGLYDPANPGPLVGALTDPAQLARVQDQSSNPFSTTAQIAQNLQKANAAANANLVARGLARSGEVGQRLAENTSVSNLDSFNAQQSFLNALMGGYNGYLQQMGGFGDKEYGYQNDALNRMIALIKANVVGASTPSANTGVSPGLAPAAQAYYNNTPTPEPGGDFYQDPNVVIPPEWQVPMTTAQINAYTVPAGRGSEYVPPPSANYGAAAPLTSSQIQSRNRRQAA